MNQLEQAIQIALTAHKNHTDKGNQPYILHPLRLMLQMDTEEQMIIAVLHDVIEDSPITLEKLNKINFSQTILKALDALTKRKNEQYKDYIDRVGKNPLATIIKQADIQDNSRIDRIKNPTPKDFDRVIKYQNAAQLLGKMGGIKSVKSRFKGKTKNEISAIMKIVRQSNLIK